MHVQRKYETSRYRRACEPAADREPTLEQCIDPIPPAWLAASASTPRHVSTLNGILKFHSLDVNGEDREEEGEVEEEVDYDGNGSKGTERCDAR
jgi:hypothetical protein